MADSVSDQLPSQPITTKIKTFWDCVLRIIAIAAVIGMAIVTIMVADSLIDWVITTVLNILKQPVFVIPTLIKTLVISVPLVLIQHPTILKFFKCLRIINDIDENRVERSQFLSELESDYAQFEEIRIQLLSEMKKTEAHLKNTYISAKHLNNDLYKEYYDNGLKALGLNKEFSFSKNPKSAQKLLAKMDERLIQVSKRLHRLKELDKNYAHRKFKKQQQKAKEDMKVVKENAALSRSTLEGANSYVNSIIEDIEKNAAKRLIDQSDNDNDDEIEAPSDANNTGKKAHHHSDGNR